MMTTDHHPIVVVNRNARWVMFVLEHSLKSIIKKIVKIKLDGLFTDVRAQRAVTPRSLGLVLYRGTGTRPSLEVAIASCVCIGFIYSPRKRSTIEVYYVLCTRGLYHSTALVYYRVQ